MRHYEIIVVLSPVLSQEESSEAWGRIKELIAHHGGDLTQEEQWGMRRLSYPIRKAGQTFLEGNYLLTRFSTDTVVPRELETHLTLAEGVIRFLVVRSGEPKPVPPPPLEPIVAEGEEAGAIAVEEPVGEEPAAVAVEDGAGEESVAVAVEEPAPEEPAPVAVEEAAGEEPVAVAVEEPAPEEPAPVAVEEAAGEEPVAIAVEEPAPEEPAAVAVEEAEAPAPARKKRVRKAAKDVAEPVGDSKAEDVAKEEGKTKAKAPAAKDGRRKKKVADEPAEEPEATVAELDDPLEAEATKVESEPSEAPDDGSAPTEESTEEPRE